MDALLALGSGNTVDASWGIRDKAVRKSYVPFGFWDFEGVLPCVLLLWSQRMKRE